MKVNVVLTLALIASLVSCWVLNNQAKTWRAIAIDNASDYMSLRADVASEYEKLSAGRFAVQASKYCKYEEECYKLVVWHMASKEGS